MTGISPVISPRIFLKKIAELILECIYHVEDTKENYKLIKQKIDERFLEWKENQQNKKKKKFWQLWK